MLERYLAMALFVVCVSGVPGVAAAQATAGDLNQQLLDAAEDGRTADVMDLLAKGAEINTRDDEGRTPLILAAGYGQTETVRALLAKGADLNAKAKDDYVALTPAALGCHRDIVEILLRAGAVVSVAEKDEVFRGVVRKCQPGLAKLLISRGANVNSKDEDGLTPLMYAASLSNTDAISLLLAAGARVNAVDNEGWTPLIYLANAKQAVMWMPAGTRVAEEVTASSESQIFIGLDQPSSSGGVSAGMYKEAVRRQLAAVKSLLARGATVQNKDKDGLTAYDHAKKVGNDSVAELLRRPPAAAPAKKKQ